jgi:hypothetical protein
MYEIQVCYTEEQNVKECIFLHTVQAVLQITITGKALAIDYQQTFDDDDLQV